MKIESLQFEDITFKYENNEPILKHCTFDFPMNQTVWVKASEGIGKSTLLQILAGLQQPQSGKFFINGEDIMSMTFEEFLPYRMKIGYSFDFGGLINNRTIFDNLILPINYHKLMSEKEAKDLVSTVVNYFDIAKFSNERPAHVPGRVRKLACVMRSLITYPDVLLMDDPSIGLGQESIYKLLDYINDLRKEGFARHIFVTSYDEKFMNLMEHNVIHLSDGNLFKSETEKRAVSL